MFHAIGSHEEHHNVVGLTADLEAETSATQRNHRRCAPRPFSRVFLARDHAAAVIAADAKRGFLDGRNHGNALRLLHYVFRDTAVWRLHQFLKHFGGFVKAVRYFVVKLSAAWQRESNDSGECKQNRSHLPSYKTFVKNSA